MDTRRILDVQQVIECRLPKQQLGKPALVLGAGGRSNRGPAEITIQQQGSLPRTSGLPREAKRQKRFAFARSGRCHENRGREAVPVDRQGAGSRRLMQGQSGIYRSYRVVKIQVMRCEFNALGGLRQSRTLYKWD